MFNALHTQQQRKKNSQPSGAGHNKQEAIMAIELPLIHDCSVSACSYNKDKACGAGAITMGAAQSCITFIPLSVKGGRFETPVVGACQQADCAHNDHLECTADAIS